MLGATCATAADWPQILGPRRDGVAVGQRLPNQLPDQPLVSWKSAVGQGYAGPVVTGDRVLLFHRIDDHECLESFDRQTGKSQYQVKFPATYRGGVNPDTGPRCVPVVDGDDVVLFGAAGVVHRVRLADGKTWWSRDIYQQFGGLEGYFGAGSTPIVVGDHIVVNVGGRDGAGIVGLKRTTGEVAWKATDAAASYSAPVRVQSAKGDRVLVVTRLDVYLIDPETGKVEANRPFGRRGPTVNAATPLIDDNRAFLTASYGIGAALIRLDAPGLPLVWANDTSLSSQYNTPVLHAGYLYGIHGREDLAGAELRCVELASGQVAWREPNFGVAHLILAGDRLLIVKIDGTIIMVRANAERFEALGEFQLPGNPITRALPALSDGQLYVRDDATLSSIQLSE